ncbi:hypothetical protein BJX68DRAFT_273091 [Aspergillus pseudodeflectus]|uniref:AMP-dependent synthetase/ligase domain-containing protein n=1 Tax=Aspergillus pseudodeflectus TaxID=176178 RepID=A0ABR4JCT3_9EURO
MALAITGLVAGGWTAMAYADAKFHLTKDLADIWKSRRGRRELARVVQSERISAWYAFEEQCHKSWNRRAIWWRERSYTYGQMYQAVCQYAQWMLRQGVRPGEFVAVYLANCPEFMIIWFACVSLGAAPALLNYNLEGKALLHCLEICETRLLILGDSVQGGIAEVRGEIEGRGIKVEVLDAVLKELVSAMPSERIPDDARQGVQAKDPFALVYTSGTTGLPKGCAFVYDRMYLMCAHDTPFVGGVPAQDQWYNSMPLYHATGGVTSALCLCQGISIALAPKFSVSRFWNDVHDSESTYFIYVGETARYLLNAPHHPLERRHKLRAVYGNGLRPDVWAKFQDRFAIPEVGEFFNSTEGMFSLINHCRGPYLQACVGHHGAMLRWLLRNMYIPVRVDYESGDIWRDPQTGFAQRTSYEEGGEMLVAVTSKEDFQGYWRSPSATAKKFCSDVFKKGDLYYRTGDALRRDADGKWHFLDRLGDTFRWKSENVSTAEVSLVLGQYPGIAEANVYGVLVPGHEGRAGCAAIDLSPGTASASLDYTDLVTYLRKRLPRYAVPVFLRLVSNSTHIHNHKQNKVPLRKEGVDPSLIGSEAAEGKDDILLWLPPGRSQYVPFSPFEWKSLVSGQAKL